MIKPKSSSVKVPINLGEIMLYAPDGSQISRSQLSLAFANGHHASYSPEQCNDGDLKNLCTNSNGADGWPRADTLTVTYKCSTGTGQSLSKVEVYNRWDCCQDRIDQYNMEFYNGELVQDIPAYSFSGSQAVYSIAVSSLGGF